MRMCKGTIIKQGTERACVYSRRAPARGRPYNDTTSDNMRNRFRVIVGASPCGRPSGISKHASGITGRPSGLYICLMGLIFMSLILTSCFGATSQSQPDPRLKVFHIKSARIVMLDNQAEVDGTLQNSGHDPFPYDVTISATFYDSAGNVIGQAQGVAEDVFPGTIGAFVLMGQVNSVH